MPSRVKRRAVALPAEDLEGPQLVSLIPQLPEWSWKTASQTSPISLDVPPMKYKDEQRPEEYDRHSSRMDIIKGYCAAAKSTIGRKFQQLTCSRDPINRQYVSAEIFAEIDNIINGQAHLTSLLDNMPIDAQKEDDMEATFTSSWDFHNLANKVITARRKLMVSDPNATHNQHKNEVFFDSPIPATASTSSSSALNPSSVPSAAVMASAQEVVSQCVQQIQSVVSQLTDETLPVYPGAEVTSTANVLGFEVRPASAQQHRLFFILRFDMREMRKALLTGVGSANNAALTASVSSPALLITSNTSSVSRTDSTTSSLCEGVEEAKNTLRSSSASGGQTVAGSSSGVPSRKSESSLTPAAASLDYVVPIDSRHQNQPHRESSTQSSSSAPTSSARRSSKQQQSQPHSSLRDRAKDVLSSASRDLRRRIGRRVALEELRSVVCVRSVYGLERFHAVLTQLLLLIDSEPPPLPDLDTFYALEDQAVLLHTGKPQASLRRRNLQKSNGSSKSTPRSPDKEDSASQQLNAAVSHQSFTMSPLSPSPHASSATSSSSISLSSSSKSSQVNNRSDKNSSGDAGNHEAQCKHVCASLESYLSDVLALYEHLDEVLSSTTTVEEVATTISLESGTRETIDMASGSSSSLSVLNRVTRALAWLLRDFVSINNSSQNASFATSSHYSHQQSDAQYEEDNLGTQSLQHVQPVLLQLQYDKLLAFRQRQQDEPGSSANSLTAPSLMVPDSISSQSAVPEGASPVSSASGVPKNGKSSNDRAHHKGNTHDGYGNKRTFWAAHLPSHALMVRFTPAISSTSTYSPKQGAIHGEASPVAGVSTHPSQPSFDHINPAQSYHHQWRAYDEGDLLKLQRSCCAGCGLPLNSALFGWLAKNYALCNYLGALMCNKWCHSGQRRVIPGRVLSRWECRAQPVSRVAAAFLDKVRHLPVIDIYASNPLLLEGVPRLQEMIELQRGIRSGLVPRTLWVNTDGLVTRLLVLSQYLQVADQLPGLAEGSIHGSSGIGRHGGRSKNNGTAATGRDYQQHLLLRMLASPSERDEEIENDANVAQLRDQLQELQLPTQHHLILAEGLFSLENLLQIDCGQMSRAFVHWREALKYQQQLRKTQQRQQWHA